ncbi:hypothetical protein GCM10010329_00110 [Streptomyces spiroverticillatus]|uniref:Lipoprotein n=1 Tax=Streptomyces finlayi TaxID=67296 RepID=A0A918WRY2_9ACTN|nr:hypothetical protein [Streptomyces finlayi]GGZ84710.1 hypothetical protein GCM10010329_00110 [Streptomyces spiroverticillatus]GHC76465.1 hypothetical protein GCM10010334_00110 [Streptomyces finlayi]
MHLVPASRPARGLTRAALLLVIVTACAAPADTPPTRSAARPVTGADLAQARGGDAERRTLFDAEQRLTAACMRERGWSYQPLTWHADVPQPEADPRRADDVELRRRAGYGAAVPERPSADPNGVRLRAMGKAQRERYGQALFGTPGHRIEVKLPDGTAFMNTDGCIAQTENRLYGDLKVWLGAQMSVMNLEGEISRRNFADPQVERTVRPWRACMKEAGHTYPDPEAAKAAFVSAYGELATRAGRNPGGAQELRRREIRVAVADATCDRRVGRARTLRARDAAHRDEVARERAEALRTYRTLREQAAARAE